MEISPEKFEAMVFLGQDPVIYQIVVDNTSLQHAKNLKYLCCEISYKNNKDIYQKPAKFAQILGILKNTIKPNMVEKSQE